MGKVKSVRLNERTERMFNVVKDYYCQRNPKVTDTEIIANGIERLYDGISKEINEVFKEEMETELSLLPEVLDIFECIYRNLEVPCIMNGDIMQDEFWGFLVVNEDESSFYEVDSETGERLLVNKQYEKIYEIVSRNFGDNLEEFEENVGTLYSVFFEKYGHNYGRKV